MADNNQMPEWFEQGKSYWRQQAQTKQGAELILNSQDQSVSYSSSADVISYEGGNHVANVGETIKDKFRHDPKALDALYRQAAETNPLAALSSSELLQQPNAEAILTHAIHAVKEQYPQENVVENYIAQGMYSGRSYSGYRTDFTTFVTIASQADPEAVLNQSQWLLKATHSVGTIGRNVHSEPVPEFQQAVTNAYNNLAATNPEKAAALAKKNNLTVEGQGADLHVAPGPIQAPAQVPVKPQAAHVETVEEATNRVTGLNEAEHAPPATHRHKKDAVLKQSTADKDGVDITTLAPSVAIPPNAPLTGDAHKQWLLEKLGFATDKGGADGIVDGQYGNISRQAEQAFAKAYASGQLTEHRPMDYNYSKLLDEAKEVFAKSITKAEHADHGDKTPGDAPIAHGHQAGNLRG